MKGKITLKYSKADNGEISLSYEIDGDDLGSGKDKKGYPIRPLWYVMDVPLEMIGVMNNLLVKENKQ